MMKTEHIAIVAMAVLAVVVAAEPAAADIDGAAQKILGILKGPLAKTAGAIAFGFAGYKTMFGHMDVKTFGAVIIGLVCIFGGTELVDAAASAGG
jgi:type IV secretory pathway VirB2 component (pilin)